MALQHSASSRVSTAYIPADPKGLMTGRQPSHVANGTEIEVSH